MGFSGFGSGFGIMPIFLFIFLAVFAFVVFIIIKSVMKEASGRSGPTEEIRGTAAAKRMDISGNNFTTTNYFVTVELDSGERKEFSAGGELYGLVAEGDRGVFTVRGSRLVSFSRIGAKYEEDVSGWHKCPACGATFKGEVCDYCNTPWMEGK